MHDTWDELLDLAWHDQGARLCARVATLAAELTALRPQIETDQPYGRALLYRVDQGEVMLASWRCDGRSAPHDHGEARGFVVVLAGHFTETSYRFEGSELCPYADRKWSAGELIRMSPAQIHDMSSFAEGLTLHLYLPAIASMRVYDRPRRATLLVSGACGAWIPRQEELILERRFWDGGASSSEK